MDPGLAADLKAQVNELDSKVQNLDKDIGNLLEVNDAINDALDAKQDALTATDGYITIENNEVFLEVDAVKEAVGSVAGGDIELRKTDTAIEWRTSGGNWQELVLLADITGPQGAQGETGADGADGAPGEAANLDAYSTTEEMNAAIAAKIAEITANYASAAELDEVKKSVVGAENVANAAKTAADKASTDVAALDTALAGKADKTYVDEKDAAINNAMALKANADSVYTKEETDATFASKSELDKAVTGDLAGLYATKASVDELTAKEASDVQTLTDTKADKTALKTVEDNVAANAARIQTNAGLIQSNADAIAENAAAITGALNGVDEKISAATENMATTDDLATYVSKSELNAKGYATGTDVAASIASGLVGVDNKITEATKDFVTGTAVDTKITAATKDFVTGTAVDTKITDATQNLATKTELTTNYATKKDLENIEMGDISGTYATIESVDAVKTDVAGLKESKADKTALNGLATKEEVAAATLPAASESGSYALISEDGNKVWAEIVF